MMNIIDSNKINLQLLKNCITKPEIFEKSTDKFWDDEYISKQMLNTPCGHFDIYRGEIFNKAVVAQLDFLKRVL